MTSSLLTLPRCGSQAISCLDEETVNESSIIESFEETLVGESSNVAGSIAEHHTGETLIGFHSFDYKL